MYIDVLIPTMRGVSKKVINDLKEDLRNGDRIIISNERTKNRSLAVARQELIQASKAEIIFFLDDDIGYKKGLLSYLSRFLSSNIGAIQGVCFPKGLGSKFDKTIREHITLKSHHIRAVKKNGIDRMFTHNTLIKKRLIDNWKAKTGIDGFEDLSIQRHIQQQGFLCLKVLPPLKTFHQTSWRKVFLNSLWNAGSYYNLMGLKAFIKRFLIMAGGFIKSLVLLPYNRRLHLCNLHMNFCIILGSLMFILGYKSKWRV